MKASQSLTDEDAIDIPDDEDDIHANIVDNSSTSDLEGNNIWSMWILYACSVID